MNPVKCMISAGMLALSALSANAEVRLPRIFSDHMVIQSGRQTNIFGKANPGEKVTLDFDGQHAETVTGANGRWRIKLQPLAPGTGGEMQIRGENQLTVKDVLAGEVWIGAGQSNMEMTVAEVTNAPQEIRQADHPAIRHFRVNQAIAPVDLDDVQGNWEICSPENVGRFSAVLYFMGRELTTAQNIPVGLINTSWGGTRIQAWLPAEAYAANPQFKVACDAKPEDYPSVQSYRQFRNEMIGRQAYQDPGNQGQALGWATPEFDDSGWKTGPIHNYNQFFGENFNGSIWLRKEVILPEIPAGQGLFMAVGPTCSAVTAYFNGQTFFSLPHCGVDIEFPNRVKIPDELIKPGRNVIALRYFSGLGTGGLVSLNPAWFRLYNQNGLDMSLIGEWHGKIEQKLPPRQFQGIYPDARDLPGAPYHGMIAPLKGLTCRGIVWYQGESNVADANYDQLLKTLIKSWREQLQMPDSWFYIVQLAGFMDRHPQAFSSNLARTREAQRRVASEIRKCGIVTAADIGDAKNVHPRNKQELGARLALLARRDGFGESGLIADGPKVSTTVREGNVIRLTLDCPLNDLVVKTADIDGFELSGDGKTFFRAQARRDDDKSIILSADGVSSPTIVRYAWDDLPLCSIYNQKNLPMIPFELSIK